MLRRGNVVVFDEHYLNNLGNLGVAGDQFSNRIDQLNNRFGSYVAGSSFRPENEYPMWPRFLRIFFDAEIEIQNI